MKWTPGYRSRDVEDRRGQGGGGMMRRGLPIGLGGMLILFVLSLLTGQDFLSLVGGGGGPVADQVSTSPGGEVAASPEEQKRFALVSEALDRVQDTWEQVLPGQYRRAKLVVFNQPLQTTCGVAESSIGPFYCPADERAYIDLSFYDDLERRFGASGDFAQAYVLAHEIGHHLQTVLGVEQQVRALQQRNPGAANQLSVLMELQADCFAGVWGHYANQKGLMDPGDFEEGLTAAAAIGDDRMMKMAGRRVNPESFTHGSSAQRVEWLRRGLQSGQPGSCDTFKAAGLSR